MKKFLNIILILLFILDIVWFLTYMFATPLNLIDEGQFASWVNNMLYGRKMYKDIYITYGPFYVYAIYIWERLTHASFQGIRTLLFISDCIIGLPAVYLILRELKCKTRTILFTLAFQFLLIPIFSVRQGFGYFVIYFQMLLLRKNSISIAYLLGFSLAVSFLVSPDIGIYSAIIIIFAYVYSFIVRKNIKQQFIFLFLTCLGSASVFVPFVLWAQSEGWFYSYLSVTKDVLFTLSGANSPLGQAYPSLLTVFKLKGSVIAIVKFIFSQEILVYWIFLFNIIIAFITVYIYFTKRLFGIWKNVILLFGFCFLVSTTLIGRFGIGHVFFVLSPIVIILFVFLETLTLRIKIKENHDRYIKVIMSAVIILFLIRILSIYRPTYFKIFNLGTFIKEDSNQVQRVGMVYLSSVDRKKILLLQQFVSRNTSKKTPIFFLKDEPGLYMIVNRFNPTNYDLPFIADSLSKRYQLLHQLDSSHVKYIFYDKLAWDVDGISNRTRIPEVNHFISTHYLKCGDIENIEIYCIKKYAN